MSLFLFQSCGLCTNDRGCTCGSTDEECDKERGATPSSTSVGVYRCESNQSTLDKSKAPLTAAGIRIISASCVTLKYPVTEGAEACVGGEFTKADQFIIPYENRNDALNLKDFNYRYIGYSYTETPCT